MNSQERVDVVAIITRLAELCPKAIFVYEGRRRLLKIGIYNDLVARVAGAIAPNELGPALRAYIRNTGYLRAMARPGAMRIYIEGNPVDAVTSEQAASAAKAVAAHWARQAARKAAARAEPAPSLTGPVHSSPAPMSERPKRLGLRLEDARAGAASMRTIGGKPVVQCVCT